VSKGIILPISTQETIFADISVTSDFSFVWLLKKITYFGKLIRPRQCRFKCVYNARMKFDETVKFVPILITKLAACNTIYSRTMAGVVSCSVV
jgi:hypothetical protein